MKFVSKTMNLKFSGEVGYLTFKDWEKYDFINHCFSTRFGGVSKNEFSSMNFRLFGEETPENIEENYKIFCKALGYDRSRLVRSRQVHGDKIKVVKKEDVYSGNLEFFGVDGFVTNVPSVVLKTSHADCCPVYMFDATKKAVGLAHAGWRGTVARISEKLALKFIECYGSEKSDLMCALGVSIGKCYFEVDEDVKKEFENLALGMQFECNENGKFNIDMKETNKRILVNFGIPPQNIIKSDICSCCNKELLFSHRATHGKRGNNAAFISIRE